MTPTQVIEIMGEPTSQSSYPTSRTFNPYSGGDDSGNRIAYKYAGQGRVVFAVPQHEGALWVIRVDYDPSEDGS
jgi:hypothetical protein